MELLLWRSILIIEYCVENNLVFNEICQKKKKFLIINEWRHHYCSMWVSSTSSDKMHFSFDYEICDYSNEVVITNIKDDELDQDFYVREQINIDVSIIIIVKGKVLAEPIIQQSFVNRNIFIFPIHMKWTQIYKESGDINGLLK